MVETEASRLARLHQVRIVLVEPAGPLNVGSIARIMKNMGLSQLVLVNPQCDPLGAEARQMAVHAFDILQSARIVSRLTDALEGCRRAIATTGRDDTTLNITLEGPRAVLPWLVEAVDGPTALLFGREDRGLTNEEINRAQRFLYIPSDAAYTSLNLAQAVALCCYELRMALLEPAPIAAAPVGTHNPASHDRLDQYFQDLESLLLKIGYLYPHTVASRMKKIRQIYNRALPSDNDVALLQGMISQMRWALQQSHPRNESMQDE
ncbi:MULTISPECIES: RNA methyltransferase [unclassified Leptolyngbya]|uniref:RNA methyltransferase n=1 Tax=unclassified Leptolyngbya TaxID=2650499 RepID=UPI001684DB64|nr:MULTISPECIES: RNA methyltransferase [unclassified Leptolyngbya]MBD1911681.1 RNA methyltransferase [Leptolyngbya sp. FACHB-8]MBD2155516.1 RNA methyltransferase [Leptolyngbya sp. FACHB-16]